MDSLRGSKIAKCGFNNEKDIADKFINWKTDDESQLWLTIMGYNLNEIENVNATILNGYKADLQLKINIKFKKIDEFQNIQIKLVSNAKGYNQIDKRWIKNYKELWNIPENVTTLLQYFTGELLPYKANTRNPKRMFMDEFTNKEQNSIIDFFENNKSLIVSDIIKGRGNYTAKWVLVSKKSPDNVMWTLKPIDLVLNHYSEDSVKITNKGNMKIGRITMQRKGGDAGRKTANMLQFKLDPTELFNLN